MQFEQWSHVNNLTPDPCWRVSSQYYKSETINMMTVYRSLFTYWKFRAWQIGRQLWPCRNVNETMSDEQGREADAADDVTIKWETSSSERNELTGPRTVQCWWCRPVMWVNTVWQSTARLIWFAGVSFVWVWRGRFASQSRTRTRRRRAVATTVTAG